MSFTLRHPNLPPVHPGEILREDVLPSLGIGKGEFAQRLGVSRQHLYDILHEKKSITPEMSLRLACFLKGKPEIWLTMQKNYDLWYAQQRFDPSQIKPFEPNTALTQR